MITVAGRGSSSFLHCGNLRGSILSSFLPTGCIEIIGTQKNCNRAVYRNWNHNSSKVFVPLISIRFFGPLISINPVVSLIRNCGHFGRAGVAPLFYIAGTCVVVDVPLFLLCGDLDGGSVSSFLLCGNPGGGILSSFTLW